MKTPSLIRTKGAQREFLVLWKGWPVEDASWVNQKDVTPLSHSFPSGNEKDNKMVKETV